MYMGGLYLSRNEKKAVFSFCSSLAIYNGWVTQRKELNKERVVTCYCQWKRINQHGFHSVFEYEPVAQLDGWTTVTMIMWDELNMEMRHHPLLQAQKLHVHNIIPSLPLVLGPDPDLDLSDPKGLLAQFLPSVSKLLLQPFPMEQYCSVYHFMAVHLVQILQGFLSQPYRQEPPPQTLLFYMSMCRHLCVVNADPEASTFNFHFPPLTHP